MNLNIAKEIYKVSYHYNIYYIFINNTKDL